MRRRTSASLAGDPDTDALPARGALGRQAREAIESGALDLLAPFSINSVEGDGDGLIIHGALDGAPRRLHVDHAIVATGFRPDVRLLQELRVQLDPALEAASALAPLIDPNEHSCGTVPPQGAKELAHPEPGFFIVGAKSYGRASTFLMATGFEQVRSVVAHLAGDEAAAARVELVLPETGVCSAPATESSATASACCSSPAEDSGDLALPLAEPAAESGCCGGPAPSGTDACCVLDADAKAAGSPGCGCNEQAEPAAAGSHA